MRIEVAGGSSPARGHVEPPGAKNAVLSMLVAGALGPGGLVLERVPAISDVDEMLAILGELGSSLWWDGRELSVSRGPIESTAIDPRRSSALRASIYALAVPLVLAGVGRIGPVGGDKLTRTLEPHARALRGFGLDLRRRGDGWEVDGGPPRPHEFVLADEGNTATGLALLLAASCEGRTVMREASLELENDDLMALLRRMGVGVVRDGRMIIVEGPFGAAPVRHAVPYDRIHAGTLMCAAGITGGDLTLPGCVAARTAAVLEVLKDVGMSVSMERERLRVRGAPVRGATVASGIYPGVPTDLLPPLSALLAVAPGPSRVVETIYAHRFGHADAFRALGVDLRVDGNVLALPGGALPRPAAVRGDGIRETAAILLLALAGSGTTTIHEPQALYRGYEDLPGELARLGAGVTTADPRPTQRSVP